METAKPGFFLIHSRPSLMKAIFSVFQKCGIKFLNFRRFERSFYVSSPLSGEKINKNKYPRRFLLFT